MGLELPSELTEPLSWIGLPIYLAIIVAQAIAAAAPTLGASTATIPGFVAAARLLCRALIGGVVHVLTRDIAQLLRLAARLFEKVGARYSVTLEKTPGGSYFDAKHLFDPPTPVSKTQARALWARLLERYAGEARGRVTVWAHDAPADGIWLTRELPALQRNPDVTGVEYMTPRDFGN